jgi:hypothetical protein
VQERDLMKRFTIAIVLAAATTAAAEPKPEEHAERFRYGNAPAAARQDRDVPCSKCVVELASATPASHGTEYILVGKDRGAFAMLRVDARQGRVVVRRVRVDLADGKTRRFDVDRAIGGKRVITIELGKPREIERVIVTTEPYGHGTYVVEGIYGSSPVGGGAR